MFIDSFIGYLKAERGYSACTLKAYGTDLRSFEEYLQGVDGSLSLLDADDDLVRRWMSHLMDNEVAASSVGRKLSSLRTFYSYLCNEGLVASSPVQDISSPKKGKRLPCFVKEQEMDKVLGGDFGEGFLALRDRLVVMLFYVTGVRLAELVGLDVSNVDMSGGAIRVRGKRDKERVIPFAGELPSLFLLYIKERERVARDDEAALFVSEKGVRISRSAVYRLVQRVLSVNGVQISKRSPHVLRHSFATAMLNNGADIGVVKELLGHMQLATTEVYTHMTFEELKHFYKKAHPRAGNN